ncbi:hypothetical protein [Pedobacter mendelii]|uniref:DUF1640 domain-containing protein n=1 Tax=Pedobacter mendelii TaxID=1908240 RepID=A0ABQ2BGM9_9SPHI|nr:hypothetical protein [Pedobacter mendelii]GGI24174.1 hypothetical protein GCM10008119_11340 [Pedobacter mendelii]
MFGIDFVILLKILPHERYRNSTFQILKLKPGERDAEELVSFVKEEVRIEFDNKREILATKEDIANIKEYILQVKSELSKSFYLVGLIQFLAIVGSVIGIINFMIK